jgi:predicted TIM-barrel fold metal-dependent hydrolase
MIVDAHVHLFPPRVFAALWRWFDAHAWSIKYRLHAEEVVAFLVERGIDRVVALHYSHKPDMARTLNRFVAEVARAHPQVTPLATVLPGEPDAAAILDEAFGPLGLRGVKLHCHVQQLAADDPRLDLVYARAAAAGLPVVIHAGSAPVSDAYGIDVRALCRPAAIRRVLERHERLKLVVPHLGAGEIDDYLALLGEFENLFLDTTMMLANFFEPPIAAARLERHADRILYGTDFPNIPYDWRRELDWLRAQPMSDSARASILGENARRLFGVD